MAQKVPGNMLVDYSTKSIEYTGNVNTSAGTLVEILSKQCNSSNNAEFMKEALSRVKKMSELVNSANREARAIAEEAIAYTKAQDTARKV